MRRNYSLFLLLAVCILSGVALAACPDTVNNAGYVRQGATGTGTGANWTNAFTALPASLSRGCTYYVAAGTYAGHLFNDAVSGSTVITIQSPTVSVHGIAAGWSDSFVGQATFNTSSGANGIFDLNTSFYVIDGAYRNADWKSGYGIHLDNTGSVVGSAVGILSFDASNNTVRNVEVEGSHSQGSPQDRGVQSFGNSNLLVSHDYIHDVGNASLLFRGTCPSSCNTVASNITLEYSYVSVDFSNPAVGHAEGISFAEGVDNIAWRYNKFVNINGTGAMANASSHTSTQDAFNGPFYIYGNLFWLDDAFWPVWYPTWCQVGGFYANINVKNTGDIYVYNNTIGNMGDNFGSCQSNGASHDGGIHFDDDGLSGGSAVNPAIDHAKNNIWWGSADAVTTGNIPAPQLDISNNTASVSSGKFVLTSTPFDFHLTSHIAGASLTNVGTYWNGTALVANTFDVDMDGTIRTTWDQGAFELATSSTSPAPSLGLFAELQ